ncbi:hypothetical protein JJJ17_09640 [Paracoccus caeni]|uniref:Uncharacterized protein n=1 Tax=Paracoccus caeni TaxID=657651 RepID=A0A934SC65_9RHOB|nr:hypothetical protein [Paracoccus caeni]MBK4216185.1 hypothetical protein [Paracoccus caeni]
MTRATELARAETRTPAFQLNDGFEDDLWSDFQPRLTEMDAVVTDNYISGCYPVLYVRCRDGRNWTIELANRVRNDAVGLTEHAVLPGDKVQIIGRRTRHFGEYRIKALHLTVGEKAYDLYPEALV